MLSTSIPSVRIVSRMDPQKKVSDVLKENSLKKSLKILDFVKFKVGEGV